MTENKSKVIWTSLNNQATSLRDFYDIWDEYPEYPVEDWHFEVANGDTRRGYWDWVEAKIDEEKCASFG